MLDSTLPDGVLAVGRLDRLRLPSLLQLVDGEGFTGFLELGKAGRMAFRDGAVVRAECGRLTGTPAVREMFLATDVMFRLMEDQVTETRLLIPLVALIVDGSRLVDEWSRVHGATVELLSPGRSAGGLSPSFLSGLRDREPVWKAAFQAGLAPSEVVDPLLAAMERGEVMLEGEGVPDPRWSWLDHVAACSAGQAFEPPTPATTPASPATDPAETLLDRARSLLKEERIDEAVAVFEAVLAASPGDRVAQQNLRRARSLLEASTLKQFNAQRRNGSRS